MPDNNQKTLMISGYYGFGNAGDEAILASMIQQLQKHIPGVRIIVLSENPDATEKEHGVEAFQRKDFWGIFKLIGQIDVLISGGGGLVQDSTGFATVVYYLAVVQLARLRGKKVMLFAQGLGPITMEKSKKAARFIMNQASLITYRDKNSQKLSEELGITRPPIHVTADPVFLLQPPEKNILDELADAEGIKGGKFKLGISVRPWQTPVQYPALVAKTADRMAEKYDTEVFIFPFQESQDKEVCEKVKNAMSHPAHLVERAYSTPQMMGLIGRMDMLIGMRLHSLIFAAVQKTPSVGISYDPKVSALMDMMDMPWLDVKDFDDDKLWKTTETVYERCDDFSAALDDIITYYQGRAEKNVELLKGLLE